MDLDLENCYIACICEGAAERAILEILLDNQRLVFDYKDMLEEKIIRTRSAKNFERQYLNKRFQKKIVIIRIIDSKNEIFKLSKVYMNKIKIIDVITAPEIEMLVIINENKYDEYKKKYSQLNPSEYCQQILKISNVKDYDYVLSYFSDINELIAAIKKYKSLSKPSKGKKVLADLLA